MWYYTLAFRNAIAFAPVAQLDRVFGYEPKGRGFESLPACHEKSHFCLPTKVTFFNDIRSLARTGDISSIWYRIAMIYACGIWGTDIISCLRSKYIIRQRRISYRVSDISLKSTTILWYNLTEGGKEMEYIISDTSIIAVNRGRKSNEAEYHLSWW